MRQERMSGPSGLAGGVIYFVIATSRLIVDRLLESQRFPPTHPALPIARHFRQISSGFRPSGTFTEIDPDEARRRSITVRGIEQVQGLGAAARRRVARVLAEAAAGRIRPIIGQTFPMAKAADVHAAIEARNVLGKTLLLAWDEAHH